MKHHVPRNPVKSDRDERRSVVMGKRVRAERKAAKAALHTGNIDYCGIFG